MRLRKCVQTVRLHARFHKDVQYAHNITHPQEHLQKRARVCSFMESHICIHPHTRTRIHRSIYTWVCSFYVITHIHIHTHRRTLSPTLLSFALSNSISISLSLSLSSGGHNANYLHSPASVTLSLVAFSSKMKPAS